MSSKQMHSLEQFLAQAQGPSVSWADVDDEPELYATADEPALEPVEEAPARSRSSRHPIPTLPRSPPFVIYCGNLSYNCTDRHLEEFFAPIKPAEVRVVVDPGTKRGKGFGYVEFRTRDEMEAAFDRNAELLLNRPIRIDVQNSRESAMERAPRQHAPPAPVPAERRKLVLKPRAADVSRPSSSTPTPKVNPFGAARPREEVLKEKAAAATAVAVEEPKGAVDQRRHSPARSKLAPVAADVQPQKSAWGPVRSVLPAPATATESSRTPKEPQQRFAWGSHAAAPPRAECEPAEPRPSRPTHRQFEPRQQGPAGSRPITPQNADKGPVRRHESERRPGPRPHEGGDAKVGPRPNGGDHRPRYRHDDRKGSREHPKESHPAPAAAVADSVAQQPKPQQSPSERVRSPSPSRAGPDDAGFEVQRKGRRHGSGRGAAAPASSSVSKGNVSGGRKEKTTDKPSSRQHAPPVEIPSSVAFSTNSFAGLSLLDDE